MKNPNLKVKVKHSESKNAWNIIGDIPGDKYKIARVPYLLIDDNEIGNTKNKSIALEHAMFIAFCFNNSNKINL